MPPITVTITGLGNDAYPQASVPLLRCPCSRLQPPLAPPRLPGLCLYMVLTWRCVQGQGTGNGQRAKNPATGAFILRGSSKGSHGQARAGPASAVSCSPSLLLCTCSCFPLLLSGLAHFDNMRVNLHYACCIYPPQMHGVDVHSKTY